MNWQERIIADPKVLAGKNLLSWATRLAVELSMTCWLEDGRSEILQNYLRLTHEDIQACFELCDCSDKPEKDLTLLRSAKQTKKS